MRGATHVAWPFRSGGGKIVKCSNGCQRGNRYIRYDICRNRRLETVGVLMWDKYPVPYSSIEHMYFCPLSLWALVSRFRSSSRPLWETVKRPILYCCSLPLGLHILHSSPHSPHHNFLPMARSALMLPTSSLTAWTLFVLSIANSLSPGALCPMKSR